MHARKIEKSEVLMTLRDCLTQAGSQGMTGREVQIATNTLNVATLVSELRHNGFKIRWMLVGRNGNETKIGRYYLEA